MSLFVRALIVALPAMPLAALAQDPGRFYAGGALGSIHDHGFRFASWPLAERFVQRPRGGRAHAATHQEDGLFLDAVANGLTNPPSVVTSIVVSPKVTYADVTQTRPVLGLGLAWRFGDRWEVRAEWARYFGIGRAFDADLGSNAKGKFDIDLASVGVTLSF